MQQQEQWIEDMLKMNDEDHAMTEKQESIVRAAIELFASKGYAASSTNEIAKKAGVAEGTIFRHYKTKKDLLLAIVAPTMAKIIGPLVLKDFHKIIEAPYATFEDFLRAVIRNRLKFVRNNIPIIKIVIQEIPFHEELRDTFKQQVAKQTIERVTKVFERFQRDGVLVQLPAPTMIRFVISSAFGLVISMLLIVPELDWDEEEEIERTVSMIMHGIAR